MKRTPKLILLSLVLALLLPFVSLNAQTETFKQGDIVVSAGLGIGHTGYWTGYSKTTLPPIFVIGDYCLREDLGPGNLGVGGVMAFSSYKDEYVGWERKYSIFSIGVRGTYHFTDLVDKLDLYGGVTLGVDIVNEKVTDESLNYDPYGSSALVGIFAGARYYFSDSFGVMGELGYDVAIMKLGVSMKF